MKGEDRVERREGREGRMKRMKRSGEQKRTEMWRVEESQGLWWRVGEKRKV